MSYKIGLRPEKGKIINTSSFTLALIGKITLDVWWRPILYPY